MLITIDESAKWHQINYRNVESVLGVQFIFDLYDQYVDDINVYRYRNVCVYYEDGMVFSYTPQKDWEYICKMVCKQMLNLDRNLEEAIIYYANRDKKELRQIWAYIDELDLNTLEDKEIGDLLYRWYYTTLNDIFKLNLAPVEHGITAAIKELLERLNSSNINEELAILLSFNQRTMAVQEEYDLILLYLSNPDIKVDDKELIAHYKKFRALHCAYGNSPWEIDYFIERINKLRNKEREVVERRRIEIESYPEFIQKRREECLKKYNNPLLNKLSDLGCRVGELRDRNKAMLGESILYRDKLIEQICIRCKLTKNDVKYYFLIELFDLIVNRKQISDDEKHKRKSGLLLETRIQMKTSTRAREFLYSKIFSSRTIPSEVLRGTCASNGKISGKVKLCYTSKDCKKMEKGDILVAYGTDFDLIEAMESAGAIVTEEGGMLSHASVISRELGKPCIIGVKNAMKILADNDVIKIDADKGLITILKKAIYEEKELITPYVYRLADITDEMLLEVGGKAYNLARLSRKGYLVMEGIVLGTKYFENLLKKQHYYDEFIRAEEIAKEGDGTKLKQIIQMLELDNDIKRYVKDDISYAVRSSGIEEDGTVASFAGQHQTMLFCYGEQSIINGIKEVWTSFYAGNAVMYRKKRGLSFQNMAGAVIIQEMLDVEFSGVMFTRNPVSQKEEIVIEVCKGQCYQLVDGISLPSRYCVDFETEAVISEEIYSEMSLNDKVLRELVRMAKQLDNVYRKSVDIEWGYSEGNIYLLQVRPITT